MDAGEELRREGKVRIDEVAVLVPVVGCSYVWFCNGLA